MRTAVLLAATLLIATGCGGEQDPNSEATASTEGSTERSAAPTVSLSTTCEGMILPAGGLLVEVSLFLDDVEDFDSTTVDTASKLYTQLGVEAADADASLAPYIEEMQQPLQEFIQAAESNSRWTLDAEAYKRAANRVNDTCAEYGGDEPVVPQPTSGGAAASPQSHSSASFSEKFADANISLPHTFSDVDEYGAYVAEDLCNPDITAESYNFKQLVKIYSASGYSEEEAKTVGQGSDLVRLVVGSYCPERLTGLN